MSAFGAELALRVRLSAAVGADKLFRLALLITLQYIQSLSALCAEQIVHCVYLTALGAYALLRQLGQCFKLLSAAAAKRISLGVDFTALGADHTAFGSCLLRLLLFSAFYTEDRAHRYLLTAMNTGYSVVIGFHLRAALRAKVKSDSYALATAGTLLGKRLSALRAERLRPLYPTTDRFLYLQVCRFPRRKSVPR